MQTQNTKLASNTCLHRTWRKIQKTYNSLGTRPANTLACVPAARFAEFYIFSMYMCNRAHSSLGVAQIDLWRHELISLGARSSDEQCSPVHAILSTIQRTWDPVWACCSRLAIQSALSYWSDWNQVAGLMVSSLPGAAHRARFPILSSSDPISYRMCVCVSDVICMISIPTICFQGSHTPAAPVSIAWRMYNLKQCGPGIEAIFKPLYWQCRFLP